MSKPPAFQFYPGDWQRDAALQSCSIGARGLWIEMICIMHQSETYGHLQINRKPVEISTLSRLIGATTRETKKLVDELENAGVFQRTSDGSIFSKRMVKDDQTRKARAAGGKKGGNPRLTLKDNQEVECKVNQEATLGVTPSSSSSSSIPPNPLLPSAGGTAGRAIDELKIPKCLDSDLGRSLIESFAAIQGKHARFDPISMELTLAQLASYPPRKALGFLAAWVQKGRFEPSYRVDWEEFAPPESEVARSSPAVPLDRKPKVPGVVK